MIGKFTYIHKLLIETQTELERDLLWKCLQEVLICIDWVLFEIDHIALLSPFNIKKNNWKLAKKYLLIGTLPKVMHKKVQCYKNNFAFIILLKETFETNYSFTLCFYVLFVDVCM